MENSPDKTSNIIIILVLAIIAIVLVVGQLVLLHDVLSGPVDQIAVKAAALVGVGNLTGFVLGGLVNALNTRSGAKPAEFKELTVAAQELTTLPKPADVQVTHADVAGFEKV